MWVLGIEPWSSRRTASALNHQTISLAPKEPLSAKEIKLIDETCYEYKISLINKLQKKKVEYWRIQTETAIKK